MTKKRRAQASTNITQTGRNVCKDQRLTTIKHSCVPLDFCSLSATALNWPFRFRNFIAHRQDMFFLCFRMLLGSCGRHTLLAIPNSIFMLSKIKFCVGKVDACETRFARALHSNDSSGRQPKNSFLAFECVVCWAATDALAWVHGMYAVAICVRVFVHRAGPIHVRAYICMSRAHVSMCVCVCVRNGSLSDLKNICWIFCVSASHNSTQVFVWNVYFILIKWILYTSARMQTNAAACSPIRPHFHHACACMSALCVQFFRF